MFVGKGEVDHRLRTKLLSGDHRRRENAIDAASELTAHLTFGIRALYAQDPALLPRARRHGAGSQGAGGSSVSMTYPVLSPVGYTVWAIKVETILDVQGLWKVVSPSGNGVVDAHKNKTARAQLLQALPEDILMQVSTKKTAKEVWESLKTRFVGADRVKTARLATLKGDFDKLCMVDGDALDDYAGKISGMAAKFAGLGSTLDDAAMVKKLLDTVERPLFGFGN